VGTPKRERQKANRAQKHEQEQQQAARRKTLRWVLIGVGAVAGVFLIAWIASNFVGDDEPTTPVQTIVPTTLPVEIDEPVVTEPDAPTTTTG